MKPNRGQSHTLEVKGDFACFTRPEMKVERFSYPAPTPSAARGVFEAIYFKPEFRWQVTRIELLSMPNYIALRRNEVKDKAPERAIKSWMKGKGEPEPLFADLTGEEGKGRTQRQTMAIKAPHYRMTAQIESRSDKPARTYDEQFIRRAKAGKCFQQPYLGCREFVCFFDYIDDIEQARQVRPPVNYMQDVGLMVYDVFDLDAVETGPARVSLFKAKIVAGVLDVPPYGSDLVLKPIRRAG